MVERFSAMLPSLENRRTEAVVGDVVVHVEVGVEVVAAVVGQEEERE